MDESKQTEDADISRSEFTEAAAEETLRNLQINGKENLQLKRTPGSTTINGYENIRDDEDSHREYQQQNKVNQSAHVLTQEDDKSHDVIIKTKDLYLEDELDEEEKDERRVHTDGIYEQNKESQHYLGEDTVYDQERKNKYKQASKIGSISMKPHLPQLKLNVPIALSSSEIFETFTNICKNQRFQVIEMEQSIATAVNKEPFSIKRMFMRCLPFQEFKKEQQTESFISAIRLQILNNEIKVCRKITLKGLYGEHQRLQEFASSFKQKIYEQVSALPESKKKQKGMNNTVNGNGNQHHQLGKKNNGKIKTSIVKYKKQNHDASDDDSDEERKHGGYNETSSLYQIHKILSSDQYTLGKNVSQYIQSFHLQYKSLRESSELLPQPIEGLMSIANETVHAFNSDYNLGKESAKSLMTYCRPAVEKYIFSKLYDKLFAMYAIKNEDEDRMFTERSGLIKRMKANDVMQYLGINEKFQINEHLNFTSRQSFVGMDQSKYNSIHRDIDPFKTYKDNDISNNFDSQRSESTPVHLGNVEHSIFNNTSTSSSLTLNVFAKHQDLPYIEAIRCIEKIQQFTSPREKLQCLSESFACLKTAIVDYWKGKVELDTMDDVLPLTIYAVAMADLSHPASELNMLEDYLRIYDKGFEFEKKLLTNFDVSIKYINHEWQFS